jgi:hypothetical protein
MEMSIKEGVIKFDKELSELDKLALLFSESLTSIGVKHVFLSGYVPILFGRNRASEDIDVVCEKISIEIFSGFWVDIHRNLICIITSDVNVAYNDYLQKNTAIRFAYPEEFIPNVEMKFEANKMHGAALSSPLNVVVNGRKLPISPLEQQIAFKLFMGSEKDIEDARFLFKLFEENLDIQKFTGYLKALNVSIDKSKNYLGWSD